jgi:hypothetical protein
MAEAKPGSERTRLAVLLAILVAVVVVAGVRFWSDEAITGRAARSDQLDYVARELPPLELAQLDHDPEGSAVSERNPFAFGPPPTPTPNLTPRPTRPPRPTMRPRQTPTPRLAIGADGRPKPPPPPFDRDYIGYFGSVQLQVAAFRKQSSDPEAGRQVEVAVVGDVLDEIFIVREIGLESVVIGFVGYDPSEDTRVPLAEN